MKDFAEHVEKYEFGFANCRDRITINAVQQLQLKKDNLCEMFLWKDDILQPRDFCIPLCLGERSVTAIQIKSTVRDSNKNNKLKVRCREISSQ